MIIRVGLLFFIYTCVNSSRDFNTKAISGAYLPNVAVNRLFNHNSNSHLRKRDTVQAVNVKNDTANSIPQQNDGGIVKEQGFSEGNGGNVNVNPEIPPKTPLTPKVADVKSESNNTTLSNTKESEKLPKVANDSPVTVIKKNDTNAVQTNVTTTDNSTIPLNSPGVVKRGLIVFGGFAVLAIAYFIFYRKKSKNYDSNSTSNNDANQFRYGVLQSDDRNNLELSRIPLTIESDEDSEDLELFDLEQKKKSLSYVNLQTNDEDIVLNSNKDSKDESKNNLLLDIEDGPSDNWTNWSNEGNKSIL